MKKITDEHVNNNQIRDNVESEDKVVITTDQEI
jgi:hypothetical protein